VSSVGSVSHAAVLPHLLKGALVTDALGVQHGVKVHVNQVVEVLQAVKATQGRQRVSAAAGSCCSQLHLQHHGKTAPLAN
jgi:hypothetical protein